MKSVDPVDDLFLTNQPRYQQISSSTAENLLISWTPRNCCDARYSDMCDCVVWTFSKVLHNILIYHVYLFLFEQKTISQIHLLYRLYWGFKVLEESVSNLQRYETSYLPKITIVQKGWSFTRYHLVRLVSSSNRDCFAYFFFFFLTSLHTVTYLLTPLYETQDFWITEFNTR